MFSKIRSYFSKYFKAKKVVVISQDEIVSIPLGPSLQVVLFCSFMMLMGWLSYSSGKYFAYQHLLDVKEKEINYTTLTNQTLKVQMADLYANLERLDHYFESIEKYGHAKSDGDSLSSKQVAAIEGTNVSNSLIKDLSSNNDEQNIEDRIFSALGSIDDRVQQRVMTLEKVFHVAGIDLDMVKKRDADLDKDRLFLKHDGPQGGPFNEPVSGSNDLKDPYLLKLRLDHNVNYLLYLEDIVHALPLVKPMKSSYISSGFGYRIDPIRKKKAMHHGLDFVGSYRAKIYSTAPGVVIRAGRNGAYGKFIEIDHGYGVITRYGHLSKLKVQKGESVERGQVIGLQGNTGRSTGAHLHYEIRYAGVPLNPYNFLKAGEYVF